MDKLDQDLDKLLSQLTMLQTHSIKDVLGKHGLRRARYYILQHLYEQPHLTLGQLSERAFLYSASASRTVYSMEKEGLVERETDENDRRIITLALTPKGKMFYKEVRADLEADIQTRYKSLDTSTKERLVTDLRLLHDVLIDYLH